MVMPGIWFFLHLILPTALTIFGVIQDVVVGLLDMVVIVDAHGKSIYSITQVYLLVYKNEC